MKAPNPYLNSTSSKFTNHHSNRVCLFSIGNHQQLFCSWHTNPIFIWLIYPASTMFAALRKVYDWMKRRWFYVVSDEFTRSRLFPVIRDAEFPRLENIQQAFIIVSYDSKNGVKILLWAMLPRDLGRNVFSCESKDLTLLTLLSQVTLPSS